MSVTYPTSWLRDDGTGAMAAMVTITDDGQATLTDIRRNEIARPSIGGRAASGQCDQARPRAKPCAKCSASGARFWLGVLWIGTPWPLKPFGRTKQDGCGCVAFLKLVWLHFKQAIVAYRKLRADTMKERGQG